MGARALESENTLLQEEKGIIMRENTSNRATLEAKIQRLETEGQQQKAALEAGEAAKAQLEAKLKKKEEEVLTLFILVIIITRALHSPCSSCLCLSPGLNDGQAALQV